MTTLREAAQQALEALELTSEKRDPMRVAAITALRTALAQQDEPCPNCASLEAQNYELDRKLAEMERAEPVAWLQPKTVDAHSRPDLGYETCSSADYGAFPVYRVPFKAEPTQEPVAWVEHEWSGTGSRKLHFEKRDPTVRDEVVNPVWTPLYTDPPQRKPLTEEEIKRICEEYHSPRQLARAVERVHGIGEQP